LTIAVISASLNPESNSRLMARAVVELLQARGAETTFIDLRDYPLPMCDGDASYGDANVARLNALLKPASVILVAVPIYNYYVNAAVKNVLELTGRAWEDKVVGFMCAAGGRSSYMSVMGFANNLMLDFRSLIIPRFVYAVGDDFEDYENGVEGRIKNPKVRERLEGLAAEAVKLSGYLAYQG
jgi:NAD(P)H-dependent FMN reductase